VTLNNPMLIFFHGSSEITWDLRVDGRALSTSWELYVIFLLIACFATSVELFKTWRSAPPFRLSRQASNPAYLTMLEASRRRLKQWIFCTFLVWGIFAASSFRGARIDLLVQKTIDSGAILLVLDDYARALTDALLVVFFMFSVRWHLLARIEHLRK
jgi:hypothetical protein